MAYHMQVTLGGSFQSLTSSQKASKKLQSSKKYQTFPNPPR